MVKVKAATLHILGSILETKMSKQAIKIGRVCGQYGKPRSSPHEIIEGIEMHSYFGDNVNSFKAGPEGRIPKPNLLLEGFKKSQQSFDYLVSTREQSTENLCKEHHEA